MIQPELEYHKNSQNTSIFIEGCIFLLFLSYYMSLPYIIYVCNTNCNFLSSKYFDLGTEIVKYLKFKLKKIMFQIILNE